LRAWVHRVQRLPHANGKWNAQTDASSGAISGFGLWTRAGHPTETSNPSGGTTSLMIVRFFARARDLVGLDSCRLDLPAGSRSRDLQRRLLEQYPGLADLLKASAIAVDQKLASADTAISSDTEVAVLPPVSGG